MFRFRYERILKLKEDDEENKKLLLAEKITKKERLEKYLKKLRSDLSLFHSDMNEKMQSGVLASDFQYFRINKKWFEEEIDSTLTNISQASIEVAMARQNLIKATQEKKKFETLKKNEERIFNDKIAKAEKEVVDQIVAYNSVKK